MRMKLLLTWFAVVSSGSRRRHPEMTSLVQREKILDLIDQGKFQHDKGGCTAPVIGPNIKLLGEVNKDCEYFGEFLCLIKTRQIHFKLSSM